MQLHGKVAIVYGGAGSMGGAVARAFGTAGARVFLGARTQSTLEAVAEQIRGAGGSADVGHVDVDERDSVERHADHVVTDAGRIDVSFNAAGMAAVQNVALVDISLDDFMMPITQAARRHFITATAAARRMAPQGSGAIVLLTSSAAKEWRHQMGGFSSRVLGLRRCRRDDWHRARPHLRGDPELNCTDRATDALHDDLADTSSPPWSSRSMPLPADHFEPAGRRADAATGPRRWSIYRYGRPVGRSGRLAASVLDEEDRCE